MRVGGVVALCVGVILACTNNPYPDADSERKIFYTTFREAPRTLDPAVAYTTSSHAVTGNVYDTLLEYHYLQRPYTLIPGLAEAIPEPEFLEDGRVRYRFRLRPGLLFHDDPAFAAYGGGATREIAAADVAFELMRIADPAVNSPVVEPFSHIDGFRAFTERLMQAREEDEAFGERPAHEQYAAVGPPVGIRTHGDLELEITLSEPYPQILFWFAMPFTTPLAWEAVDYYDGSADDRPSLADHPVGSGPYRLASYEKQSHMFLEASPNWYGVRNPEWRAPGAVYPTEGDEADLAAGRLDPAYAGQALPFIERVEFRREKESIPAFNKFLQGYYDASGIIRESFDKVVQEDRLSPEMQALDIRLEKTVSPAVYYLGFNMDDPVVGRDGGERSRKLRQAMSLVIDADEFMRLFMNGRGLAAQSPLPPGLYGYEDDYRNPFRPQGEVDWDRARQLLEEAGYPGGIDPETGRPLRLKFDTPDTSAQGRLRFQFYVDAWRKLGLDVEIAATNYNQFQEKVRNGAYQIFQWGWFADYPDPENFYFLLTTEMARSESGGPNTANFKHERFDEVFDEMRVRPNDPERMELVRELRGILEHERPWIELLHPEDYALYHGWLRNVKPAGMSYPTTKYRDLDPEARAESRAGWNQPVLWPAWAMLVLAVVLVIPGVVTFYRERQ